MMLRRTLFLLSVCGIVAFLVLGARLYQIQIIQHDEYEAAADAFDELLDAAEFDELEAEEE